MKVHIIGAGSYGTALAKAFVDKNEVFMYTIEPDVLEDINTNHRNSKYVGDVPLDGITAYDDLSFVEDSELIVLTVPSKIIPIICEQIKKYYSEQVVLCAGKGLTGLGGLLTDVIREHLECPDEKILAISGPSFAKELVNGAQTYVALGGNKEISAPIKEALENHYLHLHLTDDREGIQVLGFYKNVIAILIGVCDGLELSENFRAALLTKAYSEFYNLNKDKFHKHSFIGYAGIGDLFLTVSSTQSRNKTFGMLVAKGKSIEEIQQEIGQTIEGYENLKMINTLEGENSYFEEELISTLLNIISITERESMINELELYLKKVRTK